MATILTVTAKITTMTTDTITIMTTKAITVAPPLLLPLAVWLHRWR
ncbi:hypothetical protein KAM334_31570 [Aeromonas caviae]|nr:hypothetical protein KAM334_31570 [Aeromonas caviae]GJC02053.1 hypothetical protein KAM384_33340 [Aeromonas caviae]